MNNLIKVISITVDQAITLVYQLEVDFIVESIESKTAFQHYISKLELTNLNSSRAS